MPNLVEVNYGQTGSAGGAEDRCQQTEVRDT